MLGPEVPARTTCGGGCILADMGLVPALNAQGRKYAFDVSVETDGVGRSTQDAEAAVYFWTGQATTPATPRWDRACAIWPTGWRPWVAAWTFRQAPVRARPWQACFLSRWLIRSRCVR